MRPKVEFIEKGDSENFYQVMKRFYKELVNEWVEKGNKAEDFKDKGEKVVIILDNASFHKKEEILNPDSALQNVVLKNTEL